MSTSSALGCLSGHIMFVINLGHNIRPLILTLHYLSVAIILPPPFKSRQDWVVGALTSSRIVEPPFTYMQSQFDRSHISMANQIARRQI